MEELKENLKGFYRGKYYEIPTTVVNNLLEHIETLQKGFNAVNEDLCDTAEELDKCEKEKTNLNKYLENKVEELELMKLMTRKQKDIYFKE